MTQEHIEETIETKEEEILTPEEVEEIETLDGKTDAELTDLQVKNKKIYARMKSEREQKKALREENEKLKAEIMELKKEPVKEIEKEELTETKESDPIEFAKKVRLLSTLDDEEISYAQVLSKGLGKSVDEVITTEDFKLWQSAYKEKLTKDKNNLNPSNRTERTEKEDEFFKKFSSNLPKGFEIK